MSDSNLTKLTASLEELSLKKQLPLRQTAQKPVLKYDQSISKPIQIQNQASDFVTIRQDARNTYSSHGQPSNSHTMGPMGSVAYRLSRHTNSTPVGDDRVGMNGTPFGSYLGGQTYISPNNIGKPPTPSPTKGHSNPYARPLSAKDIVNDLQSQQKPTRKSASQMSVANGNTTSVAFPINSFMRPQSAVRKEPVPSSKTKEIVTKEQINTSRCQISKSETNSTNGYCTVFQDRPNVSNSQAQKTTTTTLTTSTGQGGLMSTTTVTTTRQGATIIQKTSPPSNHGTQVNNIISKVTEGKAIQNTQTTHKTVSRPMSSIPRPGGSASASSGTSCPSATSSVSSSSGPKPTTPEMQKVRNLNYTPTKPYTEVSELNDQLPPQPPVREKPLVMNTNPKAILPLQTTITVASFPDKRNGKNEVGSKTVNSASTSNTTTSTVYYSKGSKSEVILHEQRPPVVGAPSRDRTGSEKSGLTEGEEEGDEESEFSAPGERFPGDGEASLDDEFVDDEEDGIDCLEEDYIAGSDGESDGYSITSSLSRQSSAKSRARSARRPSTRSISSASDDARPRTAKATSTVSTDVVVRPPLTPSLFPRVPPTISFVVEGEKVETLPWDIRKLLKWRMSPITPNVVKHTLARSGFRITKRSHDWLGCWGKHMKSQGFKAIKEYQKLNHFPGSFQIGRKDRLWRNLSKMQVHFGKKEFGFFPQTFVLPYDNKLLKRAWEDGGNKQKWIIKPPASARGIGIKVISKWTQIPRKRAVIVQRYLGRPYLINDSKFDMRIYVYVSSYDPLRLYIFEDGLARFASCKYSSSMKNLNNKFMHLTNYSINKKNSEYQANGDEKVCQGHKWGLKALWNYMKRQGVNTAAIWDSIKDLVIKTIICSDSPVNSMIKANCRSRYCVHELFGFDILLDENLKPWILEVNISPSLHSNSQLDINIKGQMIRDLFNIAGFRIPDKSDVSHSSTSAPSASDFSAYLPPNDYCLDKRLFTQILAGDEKSKHAYYCQRHQDEQLAQTILDTLTPDDIRMLTESIDEDSRKGCFQRIFPTPSTHKYLKYFESPRYYNLLLNQWVLRYNRMEQKGISLLDLYCEEGVHLENPTEKAHHQWSPPSSSINSYREPRLQSAPLEKHTYTRVPLHIKSSSSSQLPKMSKKPSANKTSGPLPISRGMSQPNVGSTVMSPKDSVPQSPAPSYAKQTAIKAR